MISASAALTGSYDYSEVARSVFIAIVASYAALDLAGRVTAARSGIRLAWLSGGAIAMGIAIWAMHFKGMLAFHLPVPVEYHWPTVLASLLVAVLASAVALYVASRPKMGPAEALTGSICMGAAIGGMHYIGMAAMRLPAVTQYSPFLVTCSILLAILFSVIALLMAFALREETRWSVPRRLGSATVMGVAVSAMHYTGMAAASFIPALPPDLSYAVSVPPLGNSGVVIVALIVLVAAIATSSVDRRRGEDRLRLVIDTAPSMLHSARPDGYVDFFNKRWLEYVGVSLEELWGWQWTNVIHPEDVVDVAGKWRSSVATGRPFEAEARLRRADGEYRLMLLRKMPLRDEAGSIVKWYGSAIDIEERKRAEQELRQAEEHIRAILEYSPNWIFLKDTEGRYLMVNREIERVFGISQEQIKGKTDSEIVPPEQAAEYRANDLMVLRAGLSIEFEEIALLEDGPHTSIVHKFPLFDTHGNIYATGGVATDITERKRAEEARRYSEEQYRTVVEAASDAVISMNENGGILLANPATTRIFGYEPVELIGKSLTVLMPEFMRKLHEAGFRRYLATGQRHLNWQGTDVTGLRKNGQEFPVEVSFGEMTSNGHKVFTGFIRDITEKKRAEAELRESEARFRLVADNAPVMIWMSGTDKLCTYFNKPWLDFTGRSIDRELGNGWAEGVDPEDLQKCLETYILSFDRREAFRTEYRLRRHDGEFRWISDIGVPRFNPDRSFAGYIGSCIDVTDQRRAEEHLRQAQEDLARVSRVVAMGELAAAIAHEVNQPLGAVVTNASASLRWLAGRPPNLGEAREAIDRTVRDANRASEVIVRIRALLQKVPPQMERLDVNVVIREVLTLAGNELLRSGIAVQTDLAPDVPTVFGDRVQLQQVLLNLILNGIDAMRTISNRPRELRIKSAKQPDGVLIQVHDSGDGVNPEQANHIFDPFFTTKLQGIGIGLSVGRSIVEAHGGRLWFTPGPSHGAVFQFTVPKADTSDERAA
jgi:PAS domain S-box-containing protein